jgi:hypothetical protein
MSESTTSTSAAPSVFVKGFLPGLIIGLLIGLAVGAIVPPLMNQQGLNSAGAPDRRGPSTPEQIKARGDREGAEDRGQPEPVKPDEGTPPSGQGTPPAAGDAPQASPGAAPKP